MTESSGDANDVEAIDDARSSSAAKVSSTSTSSYPVAHLTFTFSNSTIAMAF